MKKKKSRKKNVDIVANKRQSETKGTHREKLYKRMAIDGV